jgi:hypothetical protein
MRGWVLGWVLGCVRGSVLGWLLWWVLGLVLWLVLWLVLQSNPLGPPSVGAAGKLRQSCGAACLGAGGCPMRVAEKCRSCSRSGWGGRCGRGWVLAGWWTPRALLAGLLVAEGGSGAEMGVGWHAGGRGQRSDAIPGNVEKTWSDIAYTRRETRKTYGTYVDTPTYGVRTCSTRRDPARSFVFRRPRAPPPAPPAPAPPAGGPRPAAAAPLRSRVLAWLTL